jgi:DNA-binding FadR family transcriptional regulator
MEPEQFIERLDLILPQNQEVDTIQQNSKKSNIDQLLNRLTMYFSEQLFDHTLKKGDKVESDRVLAQKLGVGRSAVREALKVLDILGMIDIRPGQGTFISNDETNFFVVPLSWSLFLNGAQTDNILEVRNVLEKKAVELAAKSTQEDAFQKLHDISHQLHKAYVDLNYQAFLNCDIEFHICLAECSGNQIIYSMIQIISNLMRHVSGTGMADENQLKEIYEEHRLVYGAVLAHDEEAAGRFMEEHLHKSMLRYNYR